MAPFRYYFCKDILNYRDISLISFFNNDVFYLINIDFNSSQSALKYLKNTEDNI